MFVDSAGVYGGLNFILIPNGRDLANNYLVQILERVYVPYEAGSVSCQTTGHGGAQALNQLEITFED